jgi:thioredoxin-related protein
LKESVKILLVLLTLPILFFYSGCQKKKESFSAEKTAIYNEEADTRKDIERALAAAGDEGKHVLLMFGGNWCPWCYRLHNLFETDEAVKDALHKKYIVVMVNVSGDKEKRDTALNDQYGNPYRYGFPVLVVLDSDGNQLTTQETGGFEKSVQEGGEKGHDPQKVLAFLNQW